MDTNTQLYAHIRAYIARIERAVTDSKVRLADAVIEGDNPKAALHLRDIAEMHDTLAALHRLLAS